MELRAPPPSFFIVHSNIIFLFLIFKKKFGKSLADFLTKPSGFFFKNFTVFFSKKFFVLTLFFSDQQLGHNGTEFIIHSIITFLFLIIKKKFGKSLADFLTKLADFFSKILLSFFLKKFLY